MHVNRDAQLAVLEAVVPLLELGATAVVVTSRWAHLYGRGPQLPQYEPIAGRRMPVRPRCGNAFPRSAPGCWS